ncbi:MAG: TRIC cation channel family protein, partial [Paramuribaculum sp.]|nr:TRIC cation channel family protein [Paramuribaculum sp.]
MINPETTFLFIIEVIGTVAFAISGIRLAAAKSFDWFGAYVVGLVTAIGGGTLRDILLDIPVFWMQTWWYLAVTGLSLALVILFQKILVHTRVLFIFDTIGLALFVV